MVLVPFEILLRSVEIVLRYTMVTQGVHSCFNSNQSVCGAIILSRKHCFQSSVEYFIITACADPTPLC